MTTQPMSFYGRLWRLVPQELGFLLPTLPVVIAGYAVLSALFSAGSGTLAVFVGVFLLVAMMYAARGFGMFELLRLRAAGRPAIEAPRWETRGVTGFWAKLFAPFANGHYWLYLLHGVLVNPIVGIVTWSIAFSWLVTAVATSTYWIYSRWLPEPTRDWGFLERGLSMVLPGADLRVDRLVADNILFAVIGVVMLLMLPFITRGLTMLHWLIARGMLSRFRSEHLAEQVAEVSASRTAAVAAEGTALRRLERDIHDGPQQRLVRMQMDLATAERKLETDPQAARILVSEAMQQAKDALEELRALSRGFAPPILLDRGLAAALDSLTLRSPVPVNFVNALPAEVALPPEIERNAYFVGAELLANAAKHASAGQIELRLGLREAESAVWLDLVVTDNGMGGARMVEGHGLAGLVERLRGVGGRLDVSSPTGGPTTVSAHLPVSAAAFGASDAPAP